MSGAAAVGAAEDTAALGSIPSPVTRHDDGVVDSSAPCPSHVAAPAHDDDDDEVEHDLEEKQYDGRKVPLRVVIAQVWRGGGGVNVLIASRS